MTRSRNIVPVMDALENREVLTTIDPTSTFIQNLNSLLQDPSQVAQLTAPIIQNLFKIVQSPQTISLIDSNRIPSSNVDDIIGIIDDDVIDLPSVDTTKNVSYSEGATPVDSIGLLVLLIH